MDLFKTSMTSGYYLLVKHFDCNDVGVVGEAELYPEMGVLVVTLSVCVGWPPAVFATVHPLDLSAACVLIGSACVKVSCVSSWSNSNFRFCFAYSTSVILCSSICFFKIFSSKASPSL